MLKKIVILGAITLIVFLYGKEVDNQQNNYIKITKKMIEDRVFYSQYQYEGIAFYTQIKFKKINPSDSFGEVFYTMMNTPESISGSFESVYYRLKNAKIIINGNDGSMIRLTLLSTDNIRWIFKKEADVDGADKDFGFKTEGKEIFYLQKPKDYPPLEKCKPFEGECFIK